MKRSCSWIRSNQISPAAFLAAPPLAGASIAQLLDELKSNDLWVVDLNRWLRTGEFVTVDLPE